MKLPLHPAYVVSADWSKHAHKRSVYIIDLQQRRIRRAESHAWNLESLLTLAKNLACNGSVLVGIDLALGVSRDYWRRVRDGRCRRQPVTFIDWLRELDPTSGFFQTTYDPNRWRVERPWFAVPPGHGGLRSFTAQAGDGFRRRIDHATQAKPLFAVSCIPGTVGSGTRDFWKALIPVLAGKRDFAVWPFEGELPDLRHTRDRARRDLSGAGLRRRAGHGSADASGPGCQDPTDYTGSRMRSPGTDAVGRRQRCRPR